jgi:chromosome segregation ATPase
MQKQTKKIKEKVYTVGEVGSLLESMDGTMKLMSENYSSLVKTQDKILAVQYDMQNQLERVEVRLGSVENRLENVENRLENVENRLENVENRLDSVETKIDRLQDDMVEVKFELKRKVDAEEFEKLEKRVVKLEQLSYSH